MQQRAPANSTAGNQATLILVLLYGGYLLSFADRVIFGLALKPIKEALQFTDSQLGILSGVAFAAAYALFSPIGGMIVDRKPRRIILSAAIGFWSLATFATAFAAGFLGMGLARAGVGVGEALLHPLAVSLVGDTVPENKRPRAFAIYMSAGAVGTMLALLLGGYLVHRLTEAGGATLPVLGTIAPWQGIFIGAALPGLALAVLVLLLMREPARQQVRHITTPVSGRAFLKANPRFAIALYLGMSVIQMGAYTLATWNVIFITRVYGWSAGEAGMVLGATCGVATVLGCFAAGTFITRLRSAGNSDAPFVVAICGATGQLLFGIAGLLMPTPYAAIPILMCASFFGYFPSIATFSAMGQVLPSNVRARLAGLHTLGNGVISNSLGPFIVGFMSDHFFVAPSGVRWSLIVTLAIAGVIGMALVGWGRKNFRTLVATSTTPQAASSPTG